MWGGSGVDEPCPSGNRASADAESLVAASACKPDEQSPQPTSAEGVHLRDEIRSQLKIAKPTIAGMLLYKLPWLWSLHFVAKLGPEALAAAALATTICNVTGMSLAVGLSFGLSTLTGQAKGDLMHKGEMVMAALRMRQNISNAGQCNDNEGMEEKEEKNESEPLLATSMEYCSYTDDIQLTTKIEQIQDLDDYPIQPLVFLYRGLLIQILFSLPIGLWWIHGIQQPLLALGQGQQLSQMTETYLRILTPGLWSYSINFTFTSWLQSIDMAHVPAYAALSGFVMHIPFNLLFVNLLGFGYEGVAMATVMFQLMQPILMCTYLFGTAHGRQGILEHTGAKGIGRVHLSHRKEIRKALSSLSGLVQYLTLALPGLVVITEWWASEVCIFLAGRLGPNPTYALGAMSIYQSINSFCFMFPIGFSAAASARVGMFLGKADPIRAKLASHVSMTGAMVLSVTMGLILLLTPHDFFPWLFTPDDNVMSETSATIPFLAVYVMADGLQTTLNGILKGCGMQAIAMPIVIVAYWCVGVPVAYYNSFVLNAGTSECEDLNFCGTAGLVAGMTMGTWTHFILLLIAVLRMIN
eukprot:CAMPEP_0183736738 /NCGR_PEP_ID=MMETSP0737-20130205/50102_1 /TAXON_ID=385413 /ORGANISM="Thalassiosira miniscula, Strain CCMP1093" /LENGTH=581 /DNA_ID=CAMNT_0025970823 /DNA_START=128 /DNA_END=1870 /DNA_ORIENTATION=+